MGKQRMNNQKPQLRPWLIEQINSGRYHGLCWLDQDRTTFRIPWKHASRQDLRENDYSIFKGWAIASGKFTDGETADPPKWKTNFRCALNSIESFDLLTDNSKDSSDPHKVYSITGHNRTAARVSDPKIAGVPDEDDYLEPKLYISPQTDPPLPSFASEQHQHFYPVSHCQEPLQEFMPDFNLMKLSDSPEGQRPPLSVPGPLNPYAQVMEGLANAQMPLRASHQEAQCLSPAQVVPSGQHWEPILNQSAQEMEDLSQEVPVEFPAPELPLDSVRGVELETPAQLSTQFPSDLDITVYYRGKEVLHTMVSDSLGCRLYHDQEDERFANLQHIKFPGTEIISDHKQREYTNCLLSNMEGGLVLWCKHGDLYGKRLGKCQVFYSLSETSENQDSHKLNRDEVTKIFSLKDFIRDIIAFTEQTRGSPLSSVYLCFGQHLLLGTPSKKLILVKGLLWSGDQRDTARQTLTLPVPHLPSAESCRSNTV
ncbi:interferon regulatory factor 7 isoform X2 [Heptranchias perlo]|uniref:interferon regulatory factor 7 isoform X2 n=1 Tax=Heptranchias perlo TaxID=212740 RepID=UPI00355A58AE